MQGWQRSGADGAAGPRVLLVGRADEAVATSLAAVGSDVRIAPTWRESSHDLHADIVAVDLRGSDSDLAAQIARIRLLSPGTRIIAIAEEDSDSVAEAIRAGADDFFMAAAPPEILAGLLKRNRGAEHNSGFPAAAPCTTCRSSHEAGLDALLSALNARNVEAPGHVERVTALTMLMADGLGVTPRDRYEIERGALLHDIGKIAIPDTILMKSSGLTDHEWSEMCAHPVVGFRMCASAEFLRGAAQIVLHHHEQWDGTGYPDGLAGTMIPLGARIFAVADAFDALTAPRPGRRPLGIDEARCEIARAGCSCFDPLVLDAFSSIPTRLLTRLFPGASLETVISTNDPLHRSAA